MLEHGNTVRKSFSEHIIPFHPLKQKVYQARAGIKEVVTNSQQSPRALIFVSLVGNQYLSQ